MKKILTIICISILPVVVIGIVILVACLLVLDFFGTNTTDGYVIENMAYADDYKNVLNENIKNGYVPLERILYFYLENDNLDLDIKRMRPISEVCSQMNYRFLSGCSLYDFKDSGQIDEYQSKPFAKPIEFDGNTITSFFMEQRIVFGKYEVHKAWDIASNAGTDVYAVCDGTIEKVSMPYKENITDTSGGLGNNIVLKCNVDETIYKITYGHLFPESSNYLEGDKVLKGEVIAKVGTTGYSTGNHLHYQVQLENDSYIDGMSLIDFSDNSSGLNPPFPGKYPSPGLVPNYGN